MTTAPLGSPLIISYIRQPAEEAEVLAQAATRFGTSPTPPGGMAIRYLLIGIFGGAALSIFLRAYRNLLLLPFLGLTPLIDISDLLAICFIPCLAVYLLLVLQLRRETRLRLIATAARIKPDVTVTVAVSPQNIVWEWAGTSLRLDWKDITDIAQRYGRIEFDSDAITTYIPAHAFHNQQEQGAMLARIRASGGRRQQPRLDLLPVSGHVSRFTASLWTR